MIALWLLVGTAVPWLAAYALVRRCDANARNDAATAWLHALLALGLALGLSSCSYFVGLLVAGGLGPGLLYGRDRRICRAGAGLLAGAAVAVGWVEHGSPCAMVRYAIQSRKTRNVLKGSAPCATHHRLTGSLHAPYKWSSSAR